VEDRGVFYMGTDNPSPWSFVSIRTVGDRCDMSEILIIEESSNISEEEWDHLGSILDKLRDRSQAPEDPPGRAARRE